jgi:cell division protein FtsZ
MSFQVKEPILIVGLGGVGSKLAMQAKDAINSDCLVISNDQKDLQVDCQKIEVTTGSIINPSVQLVRGSTYKVLFRRDKGNNFKLFNSYSHD